MIESKGSNFVPLCNSEAIGIQKRLNRISGNTACETDKEVRKQ